jgi:hypothetical protein
VPRLYREKLKENGQKIPLSPQNYNITQRTHPEKISERWRAIVRDHTGLTSGWMMLGVSHVGTTLWVLSLYFWRRWHFLWAILWCYQYPWLYSIELYEQWRKLNWKGFGSHHDIIKVLPGICLGGLRKTTENLNQDRQCPSWDSNQAPPKYKSRALLLHQPAGWRGWHGQGWPSSLRVQYRVTRLSL